MNDYSTLIIIMLAMVVLVEMMIKMIPDVNKPNGGSKFARTVFNKGNIRGGIMMFVIVALFTGFMFFKTIWEKGFTSFYAKKQDVNEILLDGGKPELPTEVSVRFQEIGNTFRIEGADGAFCPIVIYDESNNAHEKIVCCLHTSSKQNEALRAAKYASTQPVHKYAGTIFDFSGYAEPYRQAVENSGMAGEGYAIENYIIETYISSDRDKREIITMGVMMVGSIICSIIISVVYKKRTTLKENK
jgi:hypothetical protein